MLVAPATRRPRPEVDAPIVIRDNATAGQTINTFVALGSVYAELCSSPEFDVARKDAKGVKDGDEDAVVVDKDEEEEEDSDDEKQSQEEIAMVEEREEKDEVAYDSNEDDDSRVSDDDSTIPPPPPPYPAETESITSVPPPPPPYPSENESITSIPPPPPPYPDDNESITSIPPPPPPPRPSATTSRNVLPTNDEEHVDNNKSNEKVDQYTETEHQDIEESPTDEGIEVQLADESFTYEEDEASVEGTNVKVEEVAADKTPKTSHKKQTHYDLLGVDRDTCTMADIKRAHKKAVLKYHPDRRPKNGDTVDDDSDNDHAETFIQIQNSYKVLTDEVRRMGYDAELRLAELRKEEEEVEAEEEK